METLFSGEEVKVKRLVTAVGAEDAGVALDDKPPRRLSENKEAQTPSLTSLICHLPTITPEVPICSTSVTKASPSDSFH